MVNMVNDDDKPDTKYNNFFLTKGIRSGKVVIMVMT